MNEESLGLIKNRYKIGEILHNLPFCRIYRAFELANKERYFFVLYDKGLAPEAIQGEMSAWLEGKGSPFPEIVVTVEEEGKTLFLVADVPSIPISDALSIRDRRSVDEKISSFLPELIKAYKGFYQLQLAVPQTDWMAKRTLCLMDGKICIVPTLLQTLFLKSDQHTEPLHRNLQHVEPVLYLQALGNLLHLFVTRTGPAQEETLDSQELPVSKEMAELVESLTSGMVSTFELQEKTFHDLALPLQARQPLEPSTSTDAHPPSMEKPAPPSEPEKISKPSAHAALDLKAYHTTIQDFLVHIRPFNSSELLHFTDRLAMMLEAGIPVHRSLSILRDQAESRNFKKALSEICTAVVFKGKLISDAMKPFPHVFSEAYVSIVSAGEVTGKAPKAFRRLADYLEKDILLKRKLKSAMVYPFFILLVCMGLFAVFVYFTLPRLIDVFASLNIQYPLPTRVVIAVVTQVHSPLMLAFVLLAGPAAFILLKAFLNSETGKKTVEKHLLAFPLLGRLYKELLLTRFSSSLEALLESGIQFLQALSVSARTTGSPGFCGIIRLIEEEVRNGVPPILAFEENGFFPQLFCSMARVGTETGNLDFMLGKLAKIYEDNVDRLIQQLIVMIEPTVVFFMGAVVCFSVIGMLLPIYAIATRIGGP